MPPQQKQDPYASLPDVGSPDPYAALPDATVSAAAPAPKPSLRDRLTEIQKPDPNKPWALSEAAKAVGNIGAAFMTPFLHPIDTAVSAAKMVTDPRQAAVDMAMQAADNPYGFAESLIGQSAAVGTAGELAPRMIPKTTESVAAESYSPRTKALTRASGTSGTVDIPKNWERATPEIAKTVAQAPAPYEGIKGLQKAVQDTFDATQNRYSLGLNKIATREAVTTPIGEHIRAMKVADPATPEELARNAYLDKSAAEWDSRHLTYRQADRLRETAGNEIRNYYQKVKPSDAAAAAKNDIDIAINRVVDQDLGDVLYPAIDQANGLPEGTTRQLKLTQSSLYKLRDQLASQGIKMSNEQAQGLLSRLRAHSYVSTHGTIGAALGGLAEAVYPETTRVNRAVSKGLAPKSPVSAPTVPPIPLAPRKNASDDWSQQSQQ